MRLSTSLRERVECAWRSKSTKPIQTVGVDNREPWYKNTALDAIVSAGDRAPAMFFLSAAATVVPTCFCAYIARNSLRTMLPRIPHALSTLAGITIGALLAVTHVAQNLVGFFLVVGASFGPICGAMSADYLLAGRRWSGPRDGINRAGFIAWALGFFVEILKHIPGAPAGWLSADHPAGLYAFVVSFIVYWLLAKAGVRPALIPAAQLNPGAAGCEKSR